jgi:hypothetical protein
MPLSTYTELQAAIASWLNRDDLAAAIPDFIALAEAQANRRLRTRPMLARAEAEVAAEFVSLPPDFLEPVSLTIELSESDIVRLDHLAPDRLLGEKSGNPSAGQPRCYTIAGSELQFLPAPDKSYTAELTYYAALPPLAAFGTNWLLARHPDVYLYGALVQSAPYLKDDPRLETWGRLFVTALEDCRSATRVPGGKLRTETPVC